MTMRGYSLVEIAIALAVLGLLLGASLVPLQKRYEREAEKNAERILAEANSAIIGYAVANRTLQRRVEDQDGITRLLPAGRPYLPCPDTDDDGIENRTDVTLNIGITTPISITSNVMLNQGVCEEHKGALPWRTLGMREQSDPWGRRIGYRVDPVFASEITGFDETFRADIFDPRTTLTVDITTNLRFYELRADRHQAGGIVCSAVDPQPCPDITTANIPNLLAGVVATVSINLGARIVPPYTAAGVDGILDGAAFVLYSHGKNGAGGITADGGRCVPLLANAPMGERINAYYRADHMFVTMTVFGCSPVAYNSGNESENLFFSAPINELTGDDILVWVSPNALIGNLLQAGALPIPKAEFLPE